MKCFCFQHACDDSKEDQKFLLFMPIIMHVEAAERCYLNDKLGPLSDALGYQVLCCCCKIVKCILLIVQAACISPGYSTSPIAPAKQSAPYLLALFMNMLLLESLIT